MRASKAELDELAKGVTVDPAFVEFVAAGRELRLNMVIGSDGFDYVI